MVNAAHDNGDHERSPHPDDCPAARADLVNSGQDTRITLRDGSTIVLKGVRQADGAFLPDIVRLRS